MCLMCLRFQRGRSVDQDIIGEQCIRNDHGVLVAHLIDKDLVREPSSKMKNGKDVGQSGVVSEMVKVAGEAGVDMIKKLVNQITLKQLESGLSPQIFKVVGAQSCLAVAK